MLLLIRRGAAVDKQEFGAQQAHAIGAVFKRHLGLGTGGDIGRHFNAHAIAGLCRLPGLGLLLLTAQFLCIANLVHFGMARVAGCQLQATVGRVQHHALALGHVEHFGAQRDHTGQAFASGQNRDVGRCAAFGHANAHGVLCAQLQQVGGGQFMGADNRAGRQFEVPGFAQQRAQHPLLQVAQVVGALGKQRFAQRQQHRALRLDRVAPGVGGGAALLDGTGGGVQQGRVFQQREVGGEDVFFFDVLALACLRQGAANFAAHLLQRGVQALQLFVGNMRARVLRQFDTGEAKQRPTDQTGRGAYALQYTGFGVRPTRSHGYRRVVLFTHGNRECGHQCPQRRLAIGAATGDAHFITFTNAQPHQANQAVARRRLAGEVQLCMAIEPLRGLAHQRGGAGMQAATVGNAHAGAHFGDRVIHSRLQRRCRTRHNVQQRLTHLDDCSSHRP